MEQAKTATLEYINNLQQKIVALKVDCARKDQLMTKALSYIKSPDMVDKILDELNREKT